MDGQAYPGRGRGDRGAVLVEFALVAPLLFLLLFGIIEFGYNFNTYQAVRQGVREGARQAVVDDSGTGSCADDRLGRQRRGEENDLHYEAAGGGRRRRRRQATSEWQCASSVASPGIGEQLVVCAQYPMTSFTGFFSPIFSGKYFQSNIQMRIEKPSSGMNDDQESPPSGGSWSWCIDPS